MADWRPGGQTPIIPVATLTVEELIFKFKEHAEVAYKGKTELRDFRSSLLPVVRLFGTTPAKDFGPLALQTVRKAIIHGTYLTDEEKALRRKRGRGWRVCRRTTNQRVKRIVFAFKWAVEQELLSSTVPAALAMVAPLKEGKTDAVDHPPKTGVPFPLVEKTLPHLSPTVRDMVLLQHATSMRPKEVCDLRRSEIDQEGFVVDGTRVWVIRPAKRKAGNKAIVAGPQAQAILRPYLDEEREDGLVFHTHRGARWTTDSYDHRVIKACKKAGISPNWTPHQLRHAAKDRYQRVAGLDAARAVLGHSGLQMTSEYGDAQDLETAARAAAKIG